MKKIGLLFIFILSLSLLNSCVPKTISTGLFGKKQSGIDINSLGRDGVQAVLCIEQAKHSVLDTLKTFPYTRIPSKNIIKLGNKTDYSIFRTRKLALTENSIDKQGVHTLGTTCLSIDDLGRKDFSRNQIIYKVQQPTDREIAALKKSISKDARAVRNLRNRKLKTIMKSNVQEYQKTAGLSPDGIPGAKTVNALVKDTEIIDIQELTTNVAYIKKPEFKAYIIPAGKVNPKIFKKGFKSIKRVKKHALSLDEFKNMSQKSNKFFICIYMLDRLNPAKGLKWGIATSSRGKATNKSSVFYGTPQGWSVIIESFTVESEIKGSKLYVNLYSANQKDVLSGSEKIIGSYAIK